MKRASRITDWRKIEPRSLFGVRFTPNYLNERQQDLEAVVASFLTSGRTNHVIEFQGKRRYISADPRRIEWIEKPSCEAIAQPAFAVVALQCLYRLRRAQAAGAIDEAIRLAIAFAVADAEVQNLWYRNQHSYDAFSTVQQSKEKRRKTRLGKTELKDLKDIQLEVSYKEHKGKRNWLKLVTDDLIKQRGGRVVSSKTVRAELRLRRIVE